MGPFTVVFLFWENNITYTPPTNFLSYVLTGFEGEQTLSVRFMEWWPFLFWMYHYCLQEYELIIRNRLWNTGAVTQESLQTSSLGISVSFKVKEKQKYCSFVPCLFFRDAFVLSASELMKCNCCCLKRNPFFISFRIFFKYFSTKTFEKL